MADWNKPNLQSFEIDVLDEVNDKAESSAKLFYGETDTNKPVGSIQYQWDEGVFRRWSGSNWNNTIISIEGGGTGGDTALSARTNIGANNATNLTTGTINRARLPSASTSLTGAVKLNDSTSSTSITEAATANAVRKSVDEAVPSGCILMWSGSIASIPSGWALCDGGSGTPNLRDRFVVGAGSSYSPDDTGGADSVTLTTGQLPAHNHSASTSTVGNHRHAYTRYNYTYVKDPGGSRHTLWNGTTTANTGWSGSHSHSVSIGNTGSGESHENRPPYYALAFIMKL